MSENLALNPVTPEPGVLVHASSDRRLATEHWLLSTLRDPHRARTEWETQKLTVLPLGTLFCAVRIPGRLVLALADTTEPTEADKLLEEALDGGPVICDPHGPRYYAFVPASMSTRWRAAFDRWRPLGVECLGRGTHLGVPRLDVVEPAPHDSYWSVPMPSMAELCSPLAVARLIVAGERLLAGESDS